MLKNLSYGCLSAESKMSSVVRGVFVSCTNFGFTVRRFCFISFRMNFSYRVTSLFCCRQIALFLVHLQGYGCSSSLFFPRCSSCSWYFPVRSSAYRIVHFKSGICFFDVSLASFLVGRLRLVAFPRPFVFVRFFVIMRLFRIHLVLVSFGIGVPCVSRMMMIRCC